jgi:phenol 2-monooxygenase
LQQVTPNHARFCIVIFAGDAELTKESYRVFSRGLEQSMVFFSKTSTENGIVNEGGPNKNGHEHKPAVSDGYHSNGQDNTPRPLPMDFVTILTGTAANPWHLLGIEPLGRVYYDPDCSAHRRYNIDPKAGAVVVLRPDGWIGLILGLDVIGAVARLEEYFRGFLAI